MSNFYQVVKETKDFGYLIYCIDKGNHYLYMPRVFNKKTYTYKLLGEFKEWKKAEEILKQEIRT